MFKKIDIKKYGLYKDFRWLPGLKELSRMNIIYGRNYSGKTTLSRIFDGITLGALHKDYLDADFTLYTDDTTVPEVKENNMGDCPYDVRVYNSDYVNRNLSWLKNEEEGDIKPFALIGSDNVEAQRAIDEINEQLGSVEEKKGLLYTEKIKGEEFSTKQGKYEEDINSLENQLRTKANGDIKRQNYYVKQGSSYIVTNIKGDIEQILKCDVAEPEEGQDKDTVFHNYSLDESVVLSDEVKEQLRKTVDEAQKEKIQRLPEGEPHLSEYEEQVKDLVTKKITLTQTLQELVENDLLQKWVDEGRELNTERKTCAFCGNPISPERWETLNAHFSKESEELKHSLTTLREKLDKASNGLDGFLESKNFKKENIYVTYSEEYASVIGQWDEYVVGYKKAIGNLMDLIAERLANLFKPVEYTLEPFKTSLLPVLKAINDLIEKNNEYGLKLDREKHAARDKLRIDYVYQFCTDIHYTERLEKLERDEKEVEGKETEVKKLASQIKGLKDLRAEKERDKKDEGKAAQKVTKLLVNHFGNGSLSLEPEDLEDEVDEETGEIKKRTRFVVKRGGQYAKNLSEGEKSLISFCYFIAKMDDELNGPDANNLVIFIDDPISSLDSSHIFFMYSLIDSVIAEPRRYGQMFISTHNLEFLKFLKRIDLPGEWGRKEVSHYVVAKLRKGDTDEYKCEIKEMPKYLKDYVTEYNFLFQQIHEIASPVSGDKQTLYGNKYSQYYNIGNNMRKFLECYLFYRYPNTEDPIKSHLKKLFDGTVPSEVNRVVNEYSHLVWAERGLRVVDVPEIEKAAKHILKALKTKDEEHFKTLCASVGVDENIDLSLTA